MSTTGRAAASTALMDLGFTPREPEAFSGTRNNDRMAPITPISGRTSTMTMTPTAASPEAVSLDAAIEFAQQCADNARTYVASLDQAKAGLVAAEVGDGVLGPYSQAQEQFESAAANMDAAVAELAKMRAAQEAHRSNPDTAKNVDWLTAG